MEASFRRSPRRGPRGDERARVRACAARKSAAALRRNERACDPAADTRRALRAAACDAARGGGRARSRRRAHVDDAAVAFTAAGARHPEMVAREREAGVLRQRRVFQGRAEAPGGVTGSTAVTSWLVRPGAMVTRLRPL